MINAVLPTIVGIAPGAREFGIAVFQKRELVYFAVKTFKSGTSTKLLGKEIANVWQNLFDCFRPNILALKEINQYQQTFQTLAFIADCLKNQAEKSQVICFEISLSQVRKLVANTRRKPTQKIIFQKIMALYPELEQYLNRPNQRQKDYYAYLFSAVAVGLVYFA